MNKTELVSAIADKSGLSRAHAGAALDAMIDVVGEALKGDDDVRVTGFGTFRATKRAAGTARNPRTGEAVQVAASKTPRFSAGQSLKAAINEAPPKAAAKAAPKAAAPEKAPAKAPAKKAK